MFRFKYLFFVTVILAMALIISQKKHFTIFYSEKSLERSHIDDFVTYAMIRYFGIYTLFGEKPITEIDARYEPPTEEIRRELYEALPEKERAAISYNNFIINSPWGVSTKELWKAFKQELQKRELKEHFFVENQYNYEDSNYTSILFVHEPSLTKVLDLYHMQFETELGEPFNSYEKVLELKGGGSLFWDRIFREKNHYLMGIIFGFGERNSRCFQLEVEGDIEMKKIRKNPTNILEIKNSLKDEVSIEDLCLPSFVSYPEQGVDKTVEKFEVVRNEIKEQMKGKQLTEEVFRVLENGTAVESQQYSR